ncbi:GntR family transcriptional regulator [Enterococcus sp. LJL98]
MKKVRVLLYLEVAEQIKKDIFTGKYPVGSMLPTENELEEMFGVSKITVRKAIELLAADEYVEKKSGRGTTVLSNRPYNRLSKAESFTQILQNSQHEVRKEVLDLQKLEVKKGELLFDLFGEQVVRFERLYYLDEQPYIYFVHYLPPAMFDFQVETFAKESLYRLLMQKDYTIDSFSDDFLGVRLTTREQAILQTEEVIGTKRIRRSTTAEGQMVEYSEAIYNTNLHPYRIDYEV